MVRHMSDPLRDWTGGDRRVDERAAWGARRHSVSGERRGVRWRAVVSHALGRDRSREPLEVPAWVLLAFLEKSPGPRGPRGSSEEGS
jgi:hypothetical protein